MSDDLDAPPRGPVEVHSPASRYPRYPETPMPEPEEDEVEEKRWSWSVLFLLVAMVVAHAWSMAEMRQDIQTILQYQMEYAQQTRQQTPMQWKIVPN